MKVFIENETGTATKNLFNEKTLEFRKSVEVSAKYPFPYGFVLHTTSGDGDNLDCFILTDKSLKTGDIVDVEPIGMMEQIEDGETDHKIIAHLLNEPQHLSKEVESIIKDFANRVFVHIPGKRIEVGRFLPREDAIKFIEACQGQ